MTHENKVKERRRQWREASKRYYNKKKQGGEKISREKKDWDWDKERYYIELRRLKLEEDKLKWENEKWGIIANALKPALPEVQGLRYDALEKRVTKLENKVRALAHLKQRGEIDIKIEDMRQSLELDIAKLRSEQQRFILQQKKEREKWEKVRELLDEVLE